MPKMTRTARSTRTTKARTRKRSTAASSVTPALSPELETRALEIASDLTVADLGTDFFISGDPSIHAQAAEYLRDSVLMAGEYPRFLASHPTLADDAGQLTVISHVLDHALSVGGMVTPSTLLRLTMQAIERRDLLGALLEDAEDEDE
jgi:hypothetical protein